MKIMEPASLNLGIVGAGCTVKRHHLPALQAVAGAKVVAVADPNLQALHDVTSRFNISRCVMDYQVLLEDRAIHAIAICVPVPFNFEIALAALDAGKHVFIEKPLTLTLVDCDRLLTRAAETSLQVMVGFNTRWHRLARQARTSLRQGKVGALEGVRSVLASSHSDLSEWRKHRGSGGGALFEMAMHHFDLWRYLLGRDVQEITAHSCSAKWDDESAAVVARLSDGTLVSATFAECTSQANSIEIYGRKGSLRTSFYQFDGLEETNLIDYPGSIAARVSRIGRFAKELPRAIFTLRDGGDWHRSYVEQWRHFVEHVRTGRPVECGLEDGRRALAIALAAVKSAETGKTVEVEKT